MSIEIFMEKMAEMRYNEKYLNSVKKTKAKEPKMGADGWIEGTFDEAKHPKKVKRGPSLGENHKTSIKGKSLGINAAKKLPTKAKVALGLGGLAAAGGAGYGISRAVKSRNQEKAAAETINEGFEKIAKTCAAKISKR